MKIVTCKFFNPVRIGSTQISYLQPSSKIMATLTPPLIKMEDGDGNITYTSLQNIVYFTLETPPVNDTKEESIESNRSTKAPRSRGAKKTK